MTTPDMSEERSPGGIPTGIPIRNVWYLLLYAWDLADWRGSWKTEVDDSPSLLGLLGRVLAATTKTLMRQQLGRSFRERRETIDGVRGRIDFARSLKHLTFEAGRAACAFPELHVDTLRNRIIRSTLDRLARDPRVDAGVPSKGSFLRGELQQLVHELDGIALIRVSGGDFRRLQLGRNDRAYVVPLAICALLHRLQMPTDCAGDHAVVALLRDEIVWHAVYEQFVRNFCRVHLSDHDVAAETLDWFDELGSAFVPDMRTDTTIVSRTPPYRRLVIDTKFSKTTLATGPFGSAKFKSQNLYQIYAYLRTQEHRGDSYANAEGLLLYPTTHAELTEPMKVQGHAIRIATLDLSKPWPTIEARLLELVAPSARP